jgi:hypothetical protein
LEYDKQILKCSNKIKTIWDVINIESDRNIKKCGIESLNIEGKNIENQKIIVKVFIKNFTTVVENINKAIDVNYFINNDSNGTDYFNYFMKPSFQSLYPNMNSRPPTAKEMEKIIVSLKSKNSSGYDDMSTKILNISSPYIRTPLNYISNKLISAGFFPDRLKFAFIKPYIQIINMMCLTAGQYHF